MSEMSFEKKIKTIEDILNKLEDGEITLEKTMELYEKGMKLSDECILEIESAKQKIKIIKDEKETDFEN